MTLVLRYAARSDVGLVRTGNEDSGYASPTMLIVADGMGGHAAGELASAAAVATFASIDESSDSTSEADVLTALAGGIEQTTEEIRRVVDRRPELSGMGTTLTAIAWRAGLVNLVHVGDSRGYLLRAGVLQQMTRDHTYVQMLVDTGRITPEEALIHPRRNLILRAIDGVHDVEPDLQAREAHAGDRYLLCSDGLSGVIPEATLSALLAEGDPTYAVTALVEAALEAGAPDNVTVVVADVVDGPAADDPAGSVVVGAASEQRNRDRLSQMHFPADVEPGLLPLPEDAPPGAPVELDGGTARGTDHRRPRSRGQWWPLIAVAVVILGLAAATTALAVWARGQYYVGNDNGYVAIFQGVPQTVAGRQLATVAQGSQVAVTGLPEVDQIAVLGAIPASDLDDARRTVERLAAQSASCAANPTQGCPNAPTPTLPTPSAVVTPSVSPSSPSPVSSAP